MIRIMDIFTYILSDTLPPVCNLRIKQERWFHVYLFCGFTAGLQLLVVSTFDFFFLISEDFFHELYGFFFINLTITVMKEMIMLYCWEIFFVSVANFDGHSCDQLYSKVSYK